MMLLEFRMSNYRSFYHETVFSLKAVTRQKGLDYSIRTTKIAGKEYKSLCSAVIYGPNASGKTNLVGAMDTLKSILMRGNIKDASDIISPNPASASLGLIPCYNMPAKPTMLGIQFIYNEMVFDYSLEFLLGTFTEEDFDREITAERFSINGDVVFLREKNSLQTNLPKKIQELFNPGAEKTADALQTVAQSSLVKDELFLTNGFKSIFSTQIVGSFIDWIDNRFMVIYHSDAVKTIHKFTNPKNNAIYIEKTLTEVAREFGVNSNALGYRMSEDNTEPVLCSLFESGKKSFAINAELFESYGTIRFIDEFPLILKALLTGATLILDEFDASIHPMALMNIIAVFHNDEINVNHAQLVFNTHNPIFLTADLFRRDEIKFVDRDENNLSDHYSLSDFKTNGEVSVRNGEDYMSNYFINRYGAIREVDFSPIIEKVIEAQQRMGENNG